MNLTTDATYKLEPFINVSSSLKYTSTQKLISKLLSSNVSQPGARNQLVLVNSYDTLNSFITELIPSPANPIIPLKNLPSIWVITTTREVLVDAYMGSNRERYTGYSNPYTKVVSNIKFIYAPNLIALKAILASAHMNLLSSGPPQLIFFPDFFNYRLSCSCKRDYLNLFGLLTITLNGLRNQSKRPVHLIMTEWINYLPPELHDKNEFISHLTPEPIRLELEDIATCLNHFFDAFIYASFTKSLHSGTKVEEGKEASPRDISDDNDNNTKLRLYSIRSQWLDYIHNLPATFHHH